MKYAMVETAREDFVDELNKTVAKGCKPVWETYKQYINDGSEICSVIVEDPEGQTKLVRDRKPKK